MKTSHCQWLEIMPGDTRYQFGEYRVDRNSELNVPVTIPFDTAFDIAPKVVVWLSGFQMAANNEKWYLTLTPGEPTPTDFDLTVSAPHAALYQATISWFAYKASDSPEIQGGTFSTTAELWVHSAHENNVLSDNTGETNFDTAFGSPPRIIQGFSSLKISNTNIITVKVLDPTNIENDSFKWKVHTRGDTICDEAVVSYLAICDPA